MSTNLSAQPSDRTIIGGTAQREYALARANRTKKAVAIWQRKIGGAYINDAEYLFCKVGEKHGQGVLPKTRDGVTVPNEDRLRKNYELVATVEPGPI